MSSRLKNYLIVFLAGTTLTAAGLFLHTRQLLEEARRAPTLQVTRSEFAAPAAPAPATPPVVATATTPERPVGAGVPRPEPEGPPLPEPTEGPIPAGRPQRGARFAAQMAELMKDPDFAAAWRVDQEARLESRYGALFQQLNLPPDQLAKLKSLLIDREAAGREVWATAAAQGLNPRENRDQLRQLADNLQSEIDATIASTFGPTVTSALQNHAATSGQRATVNDLSQRLAQTGQSLTPAQSQQLTHILAETGDTSNGRTAIITDATLVRASGVLAPAQLEALKKLQAQQRARLLIEDKMRAAREQARE